ncbi:MAG TPA: phosphoribosylglycinamide formyltransferase [Candidatus Poseidoniaceae archaeon]|jgi:formyltetrahydrofolate-dependent phosphoribosylglycinamide formyltransferase|nr:phosphoribosylglycinamide formyltransferase [Candidatus Poseidoniaceae archaeon]
MDYKNYILPRIGTPDNPLKLGVLISGSGSGMEALINYQNQKKNCFHETTLVLSNKKNAKGVERAKEKKILTKVIELPNEGTKEEKRTSHEKLIQVELEKNNVEVIVLSGYMRILSSNFVKKWMGRLLNIHPSLLPNFPGAHAHQDVLMAGVDESGCTVHFVDMGVDSGLIIAQKKVQVYPSDKLEDLQNRIKVHEHKIYPEVIDALSEGRIQINSLGKVIIHNL